MGKDHFTVYLVVFSLVIVALFAFGTQGGDCKGENPAIYTNVKIYEKQVLYSTDRDDRFYRLSTNAGVFDIRDGLFLTWRAGEIFSQIWEGAICSLKVKTGYFLCGKYKCVIEVVSCRNQKRSK